MQGLGVSGRTSTSPTSIARRSSTSPLLPSALSGATYGTSAYAPMAVPASGSMQGIAARRSPPLVDADGCTRTVEHPDGRVEKWFVDGRRTVRFANGTAKHTLRDGTAVVTFGNGDVKRTAPDGTVHYYYKEVDTWHTTLPSATEVRVATMHIPPYCSHARCVCTCAPCFTVVGAKGRLRCIPAVHCILSLDDSSISCACQFGWHQAFIWADIWADLGHLDWAIWIEWLCPRQSGLWCPCFAVHRCCSMRYVDPHSMFPAGVLLPQRPD